MSLSMPGTLTFRQGIRDGIPICLGYLSVSFAFGVFATGYGLSVIEAVLLSLTNITSAGQLAAVPIIASHGSFLELAASQFVINLRYMLMSTSLSQKMDNQMRFLSRAAVGFAITDETFGVAVTKEDRLTKSYMLGLELLPILGWTAGTALGAAAGYLLPSFIISALGIAIYAMFLAIIIPPAKKNRPVLFCVITAAALSCMFRFIPGLNRVSTGFVVIIVGILSALVFALIFPVPDGSGDTTKEDTDA